MNDFMGQNPLFDTVLGNVIAHGTIAFFGAITHAAVAHRRGESKGVVDFFLLTVMSSFSGIVFALVSFQFFDNPYMTLAITGAGGFLGVEGLTVLAEKIRDAVGDAIKPKI